MFKKILQLTIIFSMVFFTAHFAKAQNFNLYTADDIFVETFPEIPGPNQQVSLKLNSFSFNLNNYYIAWFINGERQSADFGNRELNFTTGPSGTSTDVTAVVEVGTQVFRKELRFTPSQVDMMWEALETYAPPFYRGKKIPNKESRIKIAAIPETQLIAPADAAKLVYYWDRNFKRDVSRSGFGKQAYIFDANPLLSEEKITVTTNDRRENSFAENSINIPLENNSINILFYRINEAGRIMTNRALNNFSSIPGDTVHFSFHPLHMSTSEANFTDLFVDWNVNNISQAPQDFAKQNELHISSGGESGSVPISVTLENIEKVTQSKTEEINILFNS